LQKILVVMKRNSKRENSNTPVQNSSKHRSQEVELADQQTLTNTDRTEK